MNEKTSLKMIKSYSIKSTFFFLLNQARLIELETILKMFQMQNSFTFLNNLIKED